MEYKRDKEIIVKVNEVEERMINELLEKVRTLEEYEEFEKEDIIRGSITMYYLEIFKRDLMRKGVNIDDVEAIGKYIMNKGAE